MKCPNCKSKKPLKTKRTLAQGRECKRERFCLKCKKSVWTVELFQDDYDKELRKLRDECRDEGYRADKIERKQGTLKDALSELLDLPGEK